MRQDRTDKQQSNYRVGRRFQSLLQYYPDGNRELLQAGNGKRRCCIGADTRAVGGQWLRDEQDYDDGPEE